MLALQRSHGNAFVQRLVQFKLSVSQPGDPYEQEADRVSEAVVRMSDSPGSMGSVDRQDERGVSIQSMCSECKEEVGRQAALQREGVAAVQRQEMPEEEEEELQAKTTPEGPDEVSEQVESGIRGLQGGGQPLSREVRSDIESRMGYDFSTVRVHTDGHASGLARSVNALAFTHGSDVVFASGQYRPETEGGKRLLAHELTHVVQQTGAGGPTRQAPPSEETESET